MIRRPKREDTEEELLKQQEQFLNDNTPSAASYVGTSNEKRNLVSKETDDDAPNKKVKTLPTSPEADQSVLSDIVERTFSNFEVKPPSKIKIQANPKSFHRGIIKDAKSPKSLFLQHMELIRGEEKIKQQELTKIQASKQIHDNVSVLVDGSGLAKIEDNASDIAEEIHKENIEKINAMSAEDILLEQQKLLETLDPEIIKFLRSKKLHASVKSTEEIPMEVVKDVLPQNTESVPSANKTCDTVINSQENMDNGMSSNEKIIRVDDLKKWPHMDVVEDEKMAWMTDLPKLASLEGKAGYAPRFDFEGALIPHGVEKNVNLGLHHHGEEPAVAGYTLAELFHYSRSAMLQQRSLALNTLGKILMKCHDGWYDECFEKPLLPQLIESGLISLLRWALDENSENSIVASVYCLHNLLVSTNDELCLDMVYSWHRGAETPYINSNTDYKIDEEKELTDEELVKLDVCKGLLRMDILPRLRYILETCKPPAMTVVHIISILTRLARHSLHIAMEIANYPRLLKIIISEFLSKSWNFYESNKLSLSTMTNAYGVPLKSAIKLIRVLASSGRHLATKLVNDYSIMDFVLCYISFDLSTNDYPPIEGLHLILESFRVWRVILSYGLTVDLFIDFHPILIRQLHFFQIVSVNTNVKGNQFNFDHCSELLGLIEISARLTRRKESNDASLLNWTHIAGFQPIILLFVKKWLKNLSIANDISGSSLNLVGSALICLLALYSEKINQDTSKYVETVDEVEQLYILYLTDFMKSNTWKMLLNRLKNNSSLLCRTKSGSARDDDSLPSVDAILWNCNASPILQDESPFNFLTKFAKSCVDIFKILKRSDNTLKEFLIDDQLVLKYLMEFIQSTPNLIDHWFLRFETHFLYYLSTLALSMGNEHMQFYHEMLMKLLPHIQCGDEYIAQEVLSMLFNLDFIPEFNDICTQMDEMNLVESPNLSCPSPVVDMSRVKLIHSTCSSLGVIRSVYLKSFDNLVPRKFYYKSKYLSELNVYEIDSLSVVGGGQALLDFDFLYSPIWTFYLRKTQAKVNTEILSPSEEGIILNCLQWVHLCWCRRSRIFSQLNPQTHFCKIASVFVIGNDLFFHTMIRPYLKAILDEIFKLKIFEQLDRTTSPVSGIASWIDFCTDLFTHFEAVSYGDHLFGILILILLQQKYDIKLKRQLWLENASMLRILGAPLPFIQMNIQNILTPLEKDTALLTAYFKALVTGQATSKWCPLPYLMAIHHLHNFLFNQGENENQHKKLKSSMMQQILHLTNTELKTHLLQYGGIDKTGANPMGFIVHNEPTAQVMRVFNSYSV